MEYKMMTRKGYKVSVTGKLGRQADGYTINKTGTKRYRDFTLDDAKIKTNYQGKQLVGAGLEKIYTTGAYTVNLDYNKLCEYVYTDRNGDIKLMDDKIKNQRLLSGQDVTVILEVEVEPSERNDIIMAFNPVCVGFHNEPETYERERDRQLATHYLSRLNESALVLNKNGAEQLAIDILNADKTLLPSQKTRNLVTMRDKLVYLPQDKINRVLNGMHINKAFKDYELAYIDVDKIMDMYEITEEDIEEYKQNNPDMIKPFEYVASDPHDPVDEIDMAYTTYTIEEDTDNDIFYTDEFDIGE